MYLKGKGGGREGKRIVGKTGSHQESWFSANLLLTGYAKFKPFSCSSVKEGG